MRWMLVMLGFLSLGAFANADVDKYQQLARASNALAYIAPIRLFMEEHRMMSGKSAHFLSELGILYPEVNVPRYIHQVILIEEGTRIVALLEPDGADWVGYRLMLLDSFPYSHWECELSFRPPERTISHCDVIEGVAIEKLAPSFNCGAAKSLSENAICRHDRLMDADLQLDQAYRSLRELASESERTAFQDEQREWLRLRDSSCDEGHGYVNCPDGFIRDRTRYLNQEIAELESSR